MSKRALITGITGQDGSYLAELLLAKGYQVYGLTRRSSHDANERIVHLGNQITLLSGDLLDSQSLLDAVEASPGVGVFRRTLELELDADLGRVGRFGDGLLMGHVALGVGLDLDRVFVCGLAEGLFPTRVHDDSLLPDADRRATEARQRVGDLRRDLDLRDAAIFPIGADGARPARDEATPRSSASTTTARPPM